MQKAKKGEKVAAGSVFRPEESRFSTRSFSASEGEQESRSGSCGPLCSVNLMDLPLEAKAEPNRTGMPDRLKEGIEALSGMDMSDVRVHANSDKPAQLNALAYAQGNQIHLGPGQERHLPHEAWHVVQQRRGRVRATIAAYGPLINNETKLEKEADIMGESVEKSNHGGLQRKSVNSPRLSRLSREYLIASMSSCKYGNIIQMNGHPLSGDDDEVKIELLDFLHIFDQKGTIRNLILENSLAAKIAIDAYKKGRKNAEADTMLFKSVLATIELHRSGATYGRLTGVRPLTEEESELMKYATAPYGKAAEELLENYGLDEFEQRAIKAYSDANKADRNSEYYMGKNGKWGNHEDGWNALESALRKLPSLGNLGLEVTTYRAQREGESSSEKLRELKPGTNIIHGNSEMEMGQKHYTSTALTYNSHLSRVNKTGGVMAVTGRSGVFINPFGLQGFVDGGEILYPPGIRTRYEGTNPSGYREGTEPLPVFHMREVDKPETGQEIVEDKDFSVIRTGDKSLDTKKLKIIEKMQSLVKEYGTETLSNARYSTGIHGDIMYLMFEDLERLSNKLEEIIKINRVLTPKPKIEPK